MGARAVNCHQPQSCCSLSTAICRAVSPPGGTGAPAPVENSEHFYVCAHEPSHTHPLLHPVSVNKLLVSNQRTQHCAQVQKLTIVLVTCKVGMESVKFKIAIVLSSCLFNTVRLLSPLSQCTHTQKLQVLCEQGLDKAVSCPVMALTQLLPTSHTLNTG